MVWSMDRQGIRTLFDDESKRLKQVELSGARRQRVGLDTYADALAARQAEFRQEAKYSEWSEPGSNVLRSWPGAFSHPFQLIASVVFDIVRRSSRLKAYCPKSLAAQLGKREYDDLARSSGAGDRRRSGHRPSNSPTPRAPRRSRMRELCRAC